MKNLVKGLLTGAVIIILVTAGYASAGQNNSPGIPKEAAKKAIEHQTKGNILEDDGKLNDAITEYKESLKYNPEDEIMKKEAILKFYQTSFHPK